jgi:hypothetical protein
MRSLLNSVSTPTVILLMVGGAIVVAVVGVLAARKLFPDLADSAFEEVADGLRVVYELVFALILAFVIASVLDTFSNAESTVAAEATTLAHMKRANNALPIDEQVRLDQGLYEYVHAIAEDEWTTMRDGKSSPRAAAALETLYALYQTYSPPPAPGPEAEFYAQAVDELDQAASDRRARLGLSAAELPALLRVLLPIGALLLLALEYRPKMPRRGQLVHMGLLATVVSFCFLLTVLLDYPFSGDITVSNDPYKQGVLAEYWNNEGPRVPQPGEEKKDLSAAGLVGVWNNDAYGLIVFREVGEEIRGVYRLGQGTVVGRISPDGVLRGWWCQAPSRLPPDEAGEVEWTLVETSEGEIAFGNWRLGTQEPLHGGWNLTKVGGPEPADLAPRFDDPAAFCHRP